MGFPGVQNTTSSFCPQSMKQGGNTSPSVCAGWTWQMPLHGSIHHDLIQFSFSHYNAPAAIRMTSMVSNLYQNLTGAVSTKSWMTDPIHLQIGIYQGDHLSVLVFNTVMKTLLDTITKCHPDLGYQLSSSSIKSNLLQYANDTSLLADGPFSCKALLATTEAYGVTQIDLCSVLFSECLLYSDYTMSQWSEVWAVSDSMQLCLLPTLPFIFVCCV